jgi:hypothetical protein
VRRWREDEEESEARASENEALEFVGESEARPLRPNAARCDACMRGVS